MNKNLQLPFFRKTLFFLLFFELTYNFAIAQVVNGPIAVWGGGDQPSCFDPSFQALPLTVTIPAGLTAEHFYIQTSYYAYNGAIIPDGEIYFMTPCGRYPATGYLSGSAPYPGYGLIPLSGSGLNFDSLVLCFPPSCTAQTFNLTMYLGRKADGSGCNEIYIYYDDTFTSYPYEAYVSGENAHLSSSTNWSVNPASICADICTVSIIAPVTGGLPPYTMHHVWDTTGAGVKFGSWTAGNSSGTGVLPLTVPSASCPAASCIAPSDLTIPAPTITDSCGNNISVTGTKTVTRQAFPAVTASPTVLTACTSEPVNITLTSCIAGSISWTASNGHSGTGNISDNTTDTTTYIFSAVSNGCSSARDSVVANVRVCAGVESFSSIYLNAYVDLKENKLRIENGTSGKLMVYNILGKLQYQSEIRNPQSEIDISNLSSGLYFLELQTEQGDMVKKFVKE